MDLFKSVPTHMDFDGQKLAEKIFQYVITITAIAGLAFGYATERFSYTVYCLAAGFVLACLITLPPWPFYRRKPLKWQKPRSGGEQSGSSPASSGKSKKKK